jgi:hypothetical protein
MPIIPAFWRLRPEDCEFEASLHYISRPCHKKNRVFLQNPNTLKVWVYRKRHMLAGIVSMALPPAVCWNQIPTMFLRAMH